MKGLMGQCPHPRIFGIEPPLTDARMCIGISVTQPVDTTPLYRLQVCNTALWACVLVSGKNQHRIYVIVTGLFVEFTYFSVSL